MSKIETYGLTQYDKDNVINKIAKQKNYLESQTFLTADGTEKCLLDVSYSANLSERYYARILNKVDTFVSTSLSFDLVPIFLTVTADGFFRGMLKGDYTKFTPERVEQYRKKIPNNPRNGFYWDYILKGAYSDLKTKKSYGTPLTPKDIYKIIAFQLHRFYKSESLKNIKKAELTYTSIRVTEPHKDGVPHFHMLMYVPSAFIPSLYKDFKRFFPAPQNHKPLTFKHNDRRGNIIATVKGTTIYETQGFQTEIRSAAGYILKYILKSFKNLMEEKEIDYLQAWYVHNRIPRIITTHTLVSQEAYHKVAMMDDDWHYLTEIKQNGNLKVDRLNNYFKFDDGMGRVIIHDSGYNILVNNGSVISTYGEKKNIKVKIRLRSLTFTDTKPTDFHIMSLYEIYTPFKEYNYYINKVYDDGTFLSFGTADDFYIEAGITNEFEYINRSVSDYTLFSKDVSSTDSISSYTDLTLSQKYHDFDFDIDVPQRWALMHNEMINRGLLHTELVDVNHDLDFVPDWAVFDKFEYLQGEGIKALNYDVQPMAVKDMKVEWLKIEFDFYNSINVYENDVALVRYSRLIREIKKRGLK